MEEFRPNRRTTFELDPILYLNICLSRSKLMIMNLNTNLEFL